MEVSNTTNKTNSSVDLSLNSFRTEHVDYDRANGLSEILKKRNHDLSLLSEDMKNNMLEVLIDYDIKKNLTLGEMCQYMIAKEIVSLDLMNLVRKMFILLKSKNNKNISNYEKEIEDVLIRFNLDKESLVRDSQAIEETNNKMILYTRTVANRLNEILDKEENNLMSEICKIMGPIETNSIW